MDNVKHEFKSQTRSELGAFLQSLFGVIPSSLIFDQHTPYTVTATGGANLGKTFVWDTGRDELLGSSADIVMNRSTIPLSKFQADFQKASYTDMVNREPKIDTETKNRMLEIWHGQHRGSNHSMRLLTANLQTVYFREFDKKEQNIGPTLHNASKLPRGDARKWCDFMIASNIVVDHTNIILDMARPQNSIGDWTRVTTIETRDRELSENNAYQQLMERHCRLL